MNEKITEDEINSIIKKRIDNFELNVDVNETGKIISYADGVAQVYGLKNVMAGELVEFENGERGLASNLEEASVGIVILGRGPGLREGTSCKRLSQLLETPVVTDEEYWQIKASESTQLLSYCAVNGYMPYMGSPRRRDSLPKEEQLKKIALAQQKRERKALRRTK